LANLVLDEHREGSATVPSERRPGSWSRPLRLLLAGAVLVAAACESGRVKRPEVATTTPAGPMVERYLTDALNLIHQHAFYADRVDWPAVRAEAGRRTADATTTAGSYDTIRWVLSKLGDRHSLLLTPEQARNLKASGAAGGSFGMLALFPERVVVDVEPGGGAERAGVRVGDIVLAVDGRPPHGKQVLDLPTPQTGGGPARARLDLRRGHGTLHLTVEATGLPAVRAPTARRLTGSVNLLELFAVVGTTGDPAGSRYVRSAYDAIRGVSTATPCGWVVDLRRNTGGSLPPMLLAVRPILGDGKAIGYRARNAPPSGSPSTTAPWPAWARRWR
jgi:carboxyl-terminal processing protease